MIPRKLARCIEEQATHYPVVTVTGPRQSGKTTLCRALFPDRPHVSLEALDNRSYAREDPRGFLDEYGDGAIIDEVQHVPDLLSYLQVEVDERPEPGRFVLTGSENLSLSRSVGQSLAGRTAVLHLLPPDCEELHRFEDPPEDLFGTLWHGAFPRIHDRKIPPDRWLSDYVTTYVQRDVRSVLNVGDLEAFTTFLRLAAGRTAQEVNLSALGGDAGVSHNTARSWLSVLEAGFICFRLPAWHANVRKQVIKAPKLHFYDSGLACQLLGIHSAEQLRHHPLRGAIFESWVAAELVKATVHAGRPVRMHHYRDARRLEVDLVVERGDAVILVEAKSGATMRGSFLSGLQRLTSAIEDSPEHRDVEQVLVYGGDSGQRRSGARVLPWSRVQDHRWTD